MFDEIELGREFFEGLTAIDEAIVAQAASERCRWCGGPLHRSDYPRKPRGGAIAVAAEVFSRRFSLCCGREGCRRRAMPRSVRFLGRRIYVGVVVIVAPVKTGIRKQVRRSGSRSEAPSPAPGGVRPWEVHPCMDEG